jgi:hypothetical protein
MAELGTVLGQDGLKWWIGVVEDRGTGQFSGEKDDLKLGRIKVRIKGKHTDNKGDLPTSQYDIRRYLRSGTQPYGYCRE